MSIYEENSARNFLVQSEREWTLIFTLSFPPMVHTLSQALLGSLVLTVLRSLPLHLKSEKNCCVIGEES